MKTTFYALILALFISLPSAFAQTTAEPDIHHADRFAQKAEIVKGGNIDVVFLGDSITHLWDDAGKAELEKYFGDLRLVNLGLGWNCTQHVLWELENIDPSAISPKAVMIMIGTNNIGNKGHSAEQVIAGNEAILKKVRAFWPDAKILLLGVFPRGKEPTNGHRATIKAINAGLEKFADGEHIFFMDPGLVYLNADGTMRDEITRGDYLHLSPTGYDEWGKAVSPILHEWVK